MSALEIVTSLGDTTLDCVVVNRAVLPDGSRIAGGVLTRPDGSIARLPTRIPYGRGELVVRAFERSRRGVPRQPIDSRAIAFLVTSLAVHLAVLAIAEPWHAPEPKAPLSGVVRPRLVANHMSAARAEQSAKETPSIHDLDVDGDAHAVTQDIELEPGVASNKPEMPTAHTAAPGNGLDVPTPAAQEAARHFDPCRDGDCGLIATGQFATTSNDSRSGKDFQLAPRVPHELLQSVVTCEADGGCSTVSGQDQGAIRGEIGRHVVELNACFERGTADAKVAIDIAFDDAGAPHVTSHDSGPVGDCIARVIAKLELPSGEHSVTIAFAR
jgi:hypothetical protein